MTTQILVMTAKTTWSESQVKGCTILYSWLLTEVVGEWVNAALGTGCAFT
jgi:hypothetical protein